MNLEARLRKLEADAVTGPTHEEWIAYLEALPDRESPANSATIAAFEAANHDTSPVRYAALNALR
jgi:hypothetical protein